MSKVTVIDFSNEGMGSLNYSINSESTTRIRRLRGGVRKRL